MKILYIITQGEQGGAQKSISDLRFGMQNLGHVVNVGTGKINTENDKWIKHDFEISNLEREINLVKDVKAVFEIYKLIKKVKPDVVHLHSSKAGIVGGLACFLARVPSVYTVHGFVFLEPMNFIKKEIYIFLECVSSFLRKYTILISEVDEKIGKKYFIVRKNYGEKYELIYNGLDEKIKERMFSKIEARKYIFEKMGRVDSGEKIVGTISNFYKTKGLEYFIEGANGIQNTLFIVFGTGEESYKNELINLISKNNLQNNFYLLGKTPDAFKYLKGLDLFTLTSVKEGLPYCLLEAKLAGLPLVASRVGGIPSMSKHFYIDLVEPKNTEDIKNKIIYNLNNQTHISDELPEVYKIENMIQKTEGVYLKIKNK